MAINKVFYACMGNSDVSVRFGPFDTVEEAEGEAARLGWGWIMVADRTTNEKGQEVAVVRTRFYQPDNAGKGVEELRSKPAPAMQMSADETLFFAEYERQMATELVCAECGGKIEPGELYSVELEHLDGSRETVNFHSDFVRMCPFKWSGKRLEAAGEKLRKLLETYNGESQAGV